MTRKNNSKTTSDIQEFVAKSIKVLTNCSNEMEQIRQEVGQHLSEEGEVLSKGTYMCCAITEVFTKIYLGETNVEKAIKKLREIEAKLLTNQCW